MFILLIDSVEMFPERVYSGLHNFCNINLPKEIFSSGKGYLFKNVRHEENFCRYHYTATFDF